MSIRMILLPVFVEVALTLALLFWGSIRTRENSRAGDAVSWREEVELSVLFYVLTIVAWQTQFADLVFLLLAWVFVVIRVLRALRNGERPGGPLFISSAIVLAVMWAIYAIRLLLAI